MPTYSDPYSGRPAYSLRATVNLHSTDIANNRSRYSFRLFIEHMTSATNNSWASTARPYRIVIAGLTYSGTAPFLMGPSGDFVGKEITLRSGTTGWVKHADDGTRTISVSAFHHMSPDVQGNADLSGSFAGPTIPRNRMHAGVDGEWELCEVRVGVNGQWVMAQPRVGVDGSWRLLDTAS